MVWGNDREVTTYDNSGGCYLGPILSINITLGTVTGVGSAIRDECIGGAVVVLNGTGTGQIRRVVGASTQHSTTNVVYTLDAAFADGAQPDGWISVIPFRGRNIFHRNTYRDVGAVQFYGIGLDNILAECTGERMGGYGPLRLCLHFVLVPYETSRLHLVDPDCTPLASH
jgi:hypothetical protein